VYFSTGMENELKSGNFKTTIIKICNFKAVDIHKARNHWLKTINLKKYERLPN